MKTIPTLTCMEKLRQNEKQKCNKPRLSIQLSSIDLFPAKKIFSSHKINVQYENLLFFALPSSYFIAVL